MKKNTPPNEVIRSKAHGFITYTDNGKHYFQFRDAAAQTILFSQGYTTEKSRDNGIQSVIKNAKNQEQYEFKKGKKDKKGKYFFILKAGNHQEIARSDFFDSKEEAKEKLAIVQAIQSNVPIRDMTTEPSITNLPRHKFSIIYYPDSKVWQIKHDQSEDSKEFKTYDSQLITSFINQHLPAELNVIANPETPETQKAKQIPPKSMPAVAQTTPQAALEQVELKIRTYRRNLVKTTVKANQLGLLEVLTKNQNPNTEQVYFGQVVAKPLNNSKATIIAEVKELTARGNTLFIPINEAGKLNPGWYRFDLTLQQGNKGEVISGSQVVLLN